ncbi:MAG: ParA family protein [Bacteroidota bacterium]|nr:ParA family protein [Bacteroidota bacterium]
MNIISVLNHKGGVGKTTTSANLSAGLTSLGYRVLAIDIDGQANLTNSLGIGMKEENIYTSLKEQKKLPIYQNNEGINVVPSTLDLQAAELELANEPGRELILKRLLTPFKNDFDYIIIDCPPSLGILTLNALTASQYIIIPVEAETLALQGMAKLLSVVNKVRNILNNNLSILGILVTKYDSRKSLNKSILETIVKHFPKEVFNISIRDNVALAEAPSTGKDIFSYAPKSNGANDYMALCKEIINRIKI